MAVQAHKRNHSTSRRPSPVRNAVQVRAYAPPKYSYSTLLFAEPSFLSGMASILDVGGMLKGFNSSLSPQQADYLALLADHRAILDDVQSVWSRLLPPKRRASS